MNLIKKVYEILKNLYEFFVIFLAWFLVIFFNDPFVKAYDFSIEWKNTSLISWSPFRQELT